jgi:hypothetical protein
MKKENLLKGIIVIFGTSLSYLKYNNLKFLNFEYLGVFMIAIILIFIIAIIALNKNIYKLKWVVINPKLALLFSKFKSSQLKINLNSEKDSSDSIKNVKFKRILKLEPLFWIIGAIGFGYLLGYKYKTLNVRALGVAMRQNSNWEREAFLEFLNTFSFFYLGTNNSRSVYGGYDYNWVAFFMGIMVVILGYLIIKKTILLSILKDKLRPYIK